MKKTFKIFSIILSVLLIVCVFAGCDGSGSVEEVYKDSGISMDSVSNNIAESNGISVDKGTQHPDDVENEDIKTDDRKIIEYVDLDIETKEFDTIVEKIKTQTKEVGGYIQSSDIKGKEFYSYGSSYRSAELILRIPTSKKEGFKKFMSDNSIIVRENITTEDVTLTYVDMESRLSSLKQQKESLETLLKSAKSMSDILAIRKELTDVISDIESYTSQLKKFDSLIEYTTFTINIDEVQEPTPTEELNIFQKIWKEFDENTKDVAVTIENLTVGLIGGIPLLIFYGGILTLIVFVCVKLKNKYSTQTEKLKKKMSIASKDFTPTKIKDDTVNNNKETKEE